MNSSTILLSSLTSETPFITTHDNKRHGSNRDGIVIDGRVLKSHVAAARSARVLKTGCRRAKPCVLQTADVHELLDVAFQRLQGRQCPVLPVLQRGQVVGLLTP